MVNTTFIYTFSNHHFLIPPYTITPSARVCCHQRGFNLYSQSYFHQPPVMARITWHLFFFREKCQYTNNHQSSCTYMQNEYYIHIYHYHLQGVKRGWQNDCIFVYNIKWKADKAAKAEDVGASVLQCPVRPVAQNAPLCSEGAAKKTMSVSYTHLTLPTSCCV